MGLGQEGIDGCVIHLRGSMVLSSWGTGSYDRSTAARKLRLQPRPRPSLTPPLCESSWLSWDAFKLSRLSSVSPGVIWARFSRELNRLRLDCGGSTARRSAVGEIDKLWTVHIHVLVNVNHTSGLLINCQKLTGLWTVDKKN